MNNTILETIGCWLGYGAIWSFGILFILAVALFMCTAFKKLIQGFKDLKKNPEQLRAEEKPMSPKQQAEGAAVIAIILFLICPILGLISIIGNYHKEEGHSK